VTIVTERFREQNYKKFTTQMKQYTLNCVDGDGEYLTVKVDSKLHHCTHLLKEGAVVKLLECHPLYYHYSDRDDLRVLLLLSNFRIVWLGARWSGLGGRGSVVRARWSGLGGRGSVVGARVQKFTRIVY
jgi:hypothetical protein